MDFPIVMYFYESWPIKKAEHRRIDSFELWCWRRLLRVPWVARRSNQSTLKEISLEYSLEGQMFKVKLQYMSPLMWRTWLIWKDPDVGKHWMWEEKGTAEDEMFRWHHWLMSWVWVSSGGWWWARKPSVLQPMRSQSVGYNWATELNWTLNPHGLDYCRVDCINFILYLSNLCCRFLSCCCCILSFVLLFVTLWL